jgi:hypothetical protein
MKISLLRIVTPARYIRETESTVVATQRERIHGSVEYTVRYFVGGTPLLQYTAEQDRCSDVCAESLQRVQAS